ncbi:MAG: hypothetical protein AB1714_09770 [Acidobacteriota bacterium]
MALIICAVFLMSAGVLSADQDSLVLLKETGQVRDGKPVLALTTDTAVSKILSRGLAARCLRLFRYQQVYLQKKGGPPPEPAYLLLSSRQGGFPCYGFFLGDEDKRHAAYVDLWMDSSLTGRFGSMDQIFPHELGHIILTRLAGVSDILQSNQVHAIGVRTDPYTAFDEGFAEHFQVMAIDDDDADPSTRALALDTERRERAYGNLRAYGRELTARWSPAGRWRMTFPLWFSETEQALRYHAVKNNEFASDAAVPQWLLNTGDPYRAYLLENVCVGDVFGPRKTAARMISTEGFVSTLFYRFVTSQALQQRRRDEAFYAQFGTSQADVSPLENVYLKLFHAIGTHKTRDLVRLVDAYKIEFPEEAGDVDALLKEALLGQTLPAAPAIWLANDRFQTGTTLFDQLRGLRRTHTFELNAASLVDLVSVPGVDRPLAESILKGSPYQTIDDLRSVPGVTPEIVSTFRRMAAEMGRLQTSKWSMEEDLQLGAILYPYLWYALGCLVVAAGLGASFYRIVRPVRIFRLILNGTGAALVGLPAGWLYFDVGFMSLVAPLLLFGVPAALWQLIRCRAWRPAARAALAWAAASLPAALMVQPLL